MIKINCNGCSNNCCGKNPHLTPVLLPSEEEKFKKYSRSIQTPYGKIKVLAKKENGNCILLDEKTLKCTAYDKRPLECALYPFLLDFSKKEPSAEIDKRFCPRLNTLIANKEEIAVLIKKQHFPKDWVNAYKTLEDY